MTLESGLSRQWNYKAQSGFIDSKPPVLPSASGWRGIERIELPETAERQAITSSAIVSHQQRPGTRQGVGDVSLGLRGDLTPGQYPDFIGALLRRAFTGAVTSGALTTIAAAAGPPGTFTRSAGSWIADGFRVGMVVRPVGWAAPADSNNRNYRILALTATVMTVSGLGGEVVVTKAAGDSVTFNMVGKVTYIPQTGHLDSYFAIEAWNPNAGVSHTYVNCKPGSTTLSISGSDMAQIQMPMQGTIRVPGIAQYATAPTAAPVTKRLTGLTGTLRVGGIDAATITGCTITINPNVTPGDPVLGSKERPCLAPGIMAVSGEMTGYYNDAVMSDAYDGETLTSLQLKLDSDNGPTADFVSVFLPAIRVFSDSGTDSVAPVSRTRRFEADPAWINTLLGSEYEPTTIMFQDSAA